MTADMVKVRGFISGHRFIRVYINSASLQDLSNCEHPLIKAVHTKTLGVLTASAIARACSKLPTSVKDRTSLAIRKLFCDCPLATTWAWTCFNCRASTQRFTSPTTRSSSAQFHHRAIRYRIRMVPLLPRARCLSLLGLSPSMEEVKKIHAQMITNSLLRHPSTVGKLIECYFAVPKGANFARLLFRHRDEDSDGAFVWNVMIRCSPPEESLILYARQTVEMPRLVPDGFTYTFVLQACARLNALQEGRQVHAQIIKTGLASDVAVQTTGIHFYSTCKDIESARSMFEDMPERSSVTWNSMLTGYCIKGSSAREVLFLFREMLRERVSPTDRTSVTLLSACSQMGDLHIGSSIHAFTYKAIPSHQDCVFIGTGLVDMYSKCGCLSSACSLFGRMRQRNVLTWGAMMAGLAFHGRGRAALEMLDEMQKAGIPPNAITFTSLISACCHSGLVEEGLHLFGAMKSRFGIAPCKQHYGCIVDLLGRAGMVEEAYGIVRRMPIEPDAVVWRALLGACNFHGRAELGEVIGRILLRLELEGSRQTEPSTCQDYIALSNVYALAERWGDVSTLREVMKDMGIENKAGSTSL